MKLLNSDGSAKELVNGKYPAKVLNISHTDLDGVLSTICVEETFTDVTVHHVGYGYGLTQLVKKLREFPDQLNQYDLIIMTDISLPQADFAIIMETFQIAKFAGSWVFLDHHEASKQLHNPENNMFVTMKESGCMMTWNYLSRGFGVDLDHLKEAIKYGNDYDLWIHKFKQSKHIQYILDFYTAESLQGGLKAFRKTYAKGISYKNLSKTELKIINKKIEMLDREWNTLNVEQIDGTKIAFTMVKGDLNNEMADRILNEKSFDIDLVINFYANGTGGSIRGSDRVDGLNIAKMFKAMGDGNVTGGGHKLAAGFKLKNLGYNEPINSKLIKLKPELDHMVKLFCSAWPALRQ
jgi:oligoribonuclease NrnB/cAMP/cGMP phosphodiesterase (DHH superfamily)